jgi:hypothetical protein
MFGRRSQNLDLIPLDLDLERTHRAPVERETVEMGDIFRNPNDPENIEQPRDENHDVRAVNDEQI